MYAKSKEAEAETWGLRVNMWKTLTCIACKHARLTSYTLQSITWHYIYIHTHEYICIYMINMGSSSWHIGSSVGVKSKRQLTQIKHRI